MTISVRLNPDNEKDLETIKEYLKSYGIKKPSTTRVIKALLRLDADLISKRSSKSLMMHYEDVQ